MEQSKQFLVRMTQISPPVLYKTDSERALLQHVGLALEQCLRHMGLLAKLELETIEGTDGRQPIATFKIQIRTWERVADPVPTSSSRTDPEKQSRDLNLVSRIEVPRFVLPKHTFRAGDAL